MSLQTIPTTREILLAAFRESPPKTSRELAAAAKEIWNAYPPEVQKAIRDRYRHWFFPDVPGVGKSIACTLALLLEMEEAGFDVSLCWEYWDLGMVPSKIRLLLYKAKQASRHKPGPLFNKSLEALLSPYRERLEFLKSRGSSKLQTTTSAIVTGDVASPEDPAPTTAQSDVDQTPRRVNTARARPPGRPSRAASAVSGPRSPRKPASTGRDHVALNRRYLRLLELRGAQLRVTPTAYIERLLERDAKQSGMDGVLDREGLRLIHQTTVTLRRSAPPPRLSPAPQTKATTPQGLPVLTQRLKIVIGADEVGIDEAIKRLRKQGKAWVPRSGDLKGYISLALSTHKDDFLRVTRGIYCVLPDNEDDAAALRARVESRSKRRP